MRFALALVLVSLCAGTALADEPAACYAVKDPSGDFVPEKMRSYAADPGVAAQVTHWMNETNRSSAKCMEAYVRREGGWPVGAPAILFGARISPAGKVTQVSVLRTQSVNDAMLMACLGRSICGWELTASEDGQERLLVLPPHAIAGYRGKPRDGIN